MPRTAWFRDAIIYQVWPKSFCGKRGGSTGDFKGIISKLDYISQIADTIWLSPHYLSPMIDEGYDVQDYKQVNPAFGTLDDCKELIAECKKRNLRIIFDLVINHCSDQHEWFKQSRSSKDNPKRDWFIWRPAHYDAEGKRHPPNNWMSNFSQPAWTFDEQTQEYYLHLFAPEQPDFNWTNEEFRKQIYEDAMEYWLRLGISGFRIDTINMYSKPMDFPDAPITIPDSDIQPALDLYCNGPEIMTYMKEIGAILERYDAMSVGELPNTPDVRKVREYVGFSENKISMTFNFDPVDLGKSPNDIFKFKPWQLSEFKAIESKWQTFIQGNDSWTSTFIENHDQGRSISRFANDKTREYHKASAKMLSLLTICSSGTPFIYQGQEIGMTNVPLDWKAEEYLDVNTINYIAKIRKTAQATGKDPEDEVQKALPSINLHARDNARTPVQWTGEENAGFTSPGVKPWMRINDNYTWLNVAAQEGDETSTLSFYKRGVSMRKAHTKVFTHGDFELYNDVGEKEKIFAFFKTSSDKQRALVLMNFSDAKQSIKLPTNGGNSWKLLLTSRDDGVAAVDEPLLPYEGRVLLTV